MDNPEKLATQGTQHEEKQNNTICVGHYYTQTNTNNRTSFLCGNRNGHHNTELRT